jgi:hypothetical protein
VVRVGYARPGRGVEAHREGLADLPGAALPHHVGRVAVEPRDPEHVDDETALLRDLAHHGVDRGLADVDPAAGQLPVAGVGPPDEQYATVVVPDDRVDERDDDRRVRRQRVVVELQPGDRHGHRPGRVEATISTRSIVRWAQPHSLSYHPKTLTVLPTTRVSSLSNRHDADSPITSCETTGSVV